MMNSWCASEKQSLINKKNLATEQKQKQRIYTYQVPYYLVVAKEELWMGGECLF